MTKPRAIMLATRNQGKVREMTELVADLGVEVMSVSGVEVQMGKPAPGVVEDGTTFFANALLKAKAYSTWANLPVIAEDSGICVDVLNGAPGIYSARFAGPNATDQDNNDRLLQLLEGIDVADRGAHYHTTVVYLDSQLGKPIVEEAQWHGTILTKPVGEGGFGYDPLFWLADRQCTSAQLPSADKNLLSHRGQAMRAMVGRLKSIWS